MIDRVLARPAGARPRLFKKDWLSAIGRLFHRLATVISSLLESYAKPRDARPSLWIGRLLIQSDLYRGADESRRIVALGGVLSMGKEPRSTQCPHLVTGYGHSYCV
jgi:hypothetical protein